MVERFKWGDERMAAAIDGPWVSIDAYRELEADLSAALMITRSNETEVTRLRQVLKTMVGDERCGYCGALDNGTCAYPSEGKPGCVRDARLSREGGGS